MATRVGQFIRSILRFVRGGVRNSSIQNRVKANSRRESGLKEELGALTLIR